MLYKLLMASLSQFRKDKAITPEYEDSLLVIGYVLKMITKHANPAAASVLLVRMFGNSMIRLLY
jgi:hypothetical protein